MSLSYFVKRSVLKYGLLGSIARNAIKQLNKWKTSQPNLSEAKIANNMFDTYSLFEFPIRERIKINKYYASDFKCRSLLDFCLISLDIEGNINPLDIKLFNKTAKVLEDILDDYGYKKEDELTGTFLDNINVSSSRVRSFYFQWSDKIMGYKFTI